MSVADVVEFDPCGELPAGITVLEASAGTGKTYAIAALAARYVAEGTPLDQLLLVTFTRMATSELRERVRDRLLDTEQALDRALDGGALDAHDALARMLATGSRDELALRRHRIARALADFDTATIATTHAFCQEVLSGLGIIGDLERDVRFVEDVSDLRDEAVDDLYVRRFHWQAPEFTREDAIAIAKLAVENPLAPVEPAQAGEHTIAAMRVRFAHAVRRELEARKRRARIMSYDDLLTRLAETLGGSGGHAAAARLRERFRVVLVDEFQDTDPIQWEIMRRAFGDGTLILIGDPKQAIYAFRGADVHAYLRARESAAANATLAVNWRSDERLIRAYDAVFDGASLGHPGIVYRKVRAADCHHGSRLCDAPDPAALRVRIADRAHPAVSRTRMGHAHKRSAQELIAADLAADVVRLLESPARLERRDEDGSTLGLEPVCPGHIAVLVPTHRHAAMVRDALDAAGVPAVINGAGSVFATPPAREWLRLLAALEQPTSATRVRSAALTAFVGWTPEQLADADDAALEALHGRLHDWGRTLRAKGVAALLEAVALTEGLPARVLARADGERWMTDLRHVAQLLHAAATTDHLGVAAMTGWLRQRIDKAEQEGDEERSRRLESDAEAVQVLTIHRSKGLEFPFVYYPFGWEPWFIPDRNDPVYFHDPDNDDERTIDVGCEGRGYILNKSRHAIEQRGEDLRLAYVSLTRARHQAVIWWASSWDSRESPLGRLLFGRDEDGVISPDPLDAPPTEDQVRERFLALAAGAAISVSDAAPGPLRRWTPVAREARELAANSFDRALDVRWRRTSFSDITAGAFDARVTSEPEQPQVVDEPEGEIPLRSPDPAPEGASAPSLLAGMPIGLIVGTLVHRVFETIDFTADDLREQLRDAVGARRERVLELDEDAVADGLAAAIETPLGPLTGDLRLRDVGRADRLDELDFELPLAGGDRPHGDVTLRAIAATLRAHLPAGDPLAAYADRLGDPSLRASVHGYLAGSIDLVLRFRAGEDWRFAVVDYKTNWLGPPGEELTAWHHRPDALAGEMVRHHYALQAMIYTVAVHRYLRGRLPGYDPDRDLSGVLYLFVRGMLGPDTPRIDGQPCGVFAWRPPSALVEALSDMLDEGGAP